MDKDLMQTVQHSEAMSVVAEELPKDPKKAFELMSQLHKKYKNIFIDDMKTKSGKFVDKFMDDDKDTYY